MKAALMAAMVGCVFAPTSFAFSADSGPVTSSPARGELTQKALAVCVKPTTEDVLGLAAAASESGVDGILGVAEQSTGFLQADFISNPNDGGDVVFDVACTGVVEDFSLPNSNAFYLSVTENWGTSGAAVELLVLEVVETHNAIANFGSLAMPLGLEVSDYPRSQLSILPVGKKAGASNPAVTQQGVTSFR